MVTKGRELSWALVVSGFQAETTDDFVQTNVLLLRRFTGTDAQDAVKLFFVGLSAGEVVERFCGLLD